MKGFKESSGFTDPLKRFSYQKGFNIGKGFQDWALLNPAYIALKNTILADGGEIGSQSDLNSYITMAKANGIYDNIEFGMLGAYNIRTSGNTKYVTKAYSLDATPNDATQTTENLQPYSSGFIAPNEKWGIKNSTGENRLFSIPGITITGTITRVESTDITGKVNITHTDVVLQNITSIIPDILTVAYFVRNETLTASQKAAEAAKLRQIFPEIPSVNIDGIVVQTSNNEMVATPQGNVIQEMQVNSAVEKVQNVGFDSDTWWLKKPNTLIEDGVAKLGTAINDGVFKDALTVGKWYKCTFTITNIDSGSVHISAGQTYGTERNTIGTYTEYLKCSIDGSIRVYLSSPSTNVYVDNVSVQEIGWADSQELYDGLIAQGLTVQEALEASGNWSYHSNDASLGAIYGKIYNGYARDLLVTDIAALGTWGYHVSIEAELTALALNGGYALKYGGTDYWNTANGTNATGFTALGGGTRSDVDGTFSTIKDSTAFWCADSDKVLLLNHADNTATIVAANKSFGAYIRLVKD